AATGNAWVVDPVGTIEYLAHVVDDDPYPFDRSPRIPTADLKQGYVIFIHSSDGSRRRVANQPHIAIGRATLVICHTEAWAGQRFQPQRVVVCRHTRLPDSFGPDDQRQDRIAHRSFLSLRIVSAIAIHSAADLLSMV